MKDLIVCLRSEDTRQRGHIHRQVGQDSLLVTRAHARVSSAAVKSPLWLSPCLPNGYGLLLVPAPVYVV